MTKRKPIITQREIHVDGKTLVWTFEYVPETAYNTGGFIYMTDEYGYRCWYNSEPLAIMENLIRLGIVGREIN